jgi:hypothetical protein
MKNVDLNSNSTVDRRIRRHKIESLTGRCSHCPPHSGENRSRQEHGDRGKNHRRGH